MYWKLVEVTEFDALEGSLAMATQNIIAICCAPTKKEADAYFKYLDRCGNIHYTNTAEIVESSREEFLDFIGA